VEKPSTGVSAAPGASLPRSAARRLLNRGGIDGLRSSDATRPLFSLAVPGGFRGPESLRRWPAGRAAAPRPPPRRGGGGGGGGGGGAAAAAGAGAAPAPP
jgi:hypothetical protein